MKTGLRELGVAVRRHLNSLRMLGKMRSGEGRNKRNGLWMKSGHNKLWKQPVKNRNGNGMHCLGDQPKSLFTTHDLHLLMLGEEMKQNTAAKILEII